MNLLKCFFIFLLIPLYAKSEKKVIIYKTQENIKLDGKLDESFWVQAEVINDFFQQFPDDSIFSEMISEVRIAFSSQKIFVSAKLYDSVPERYIVNTLKRDFFGP